MLPGVAAGSMSIVRLYCANQIAAYSCSHKIDFCSCVGRYPLPSVTAIGQFTGRTCWPTSLCSVNQRRTA